MGKLPRMPRIAGSNGIFNAYSYGILSARQFIRAILSLRVTFNLLLISFLEN